MHITVQLHSCCSCCTRLSVLQAGAWLHVPALVITLLPLTLAGSLTGLTCQGAVECLQPCRTYG